MSCAQCEEAEATLWCLDEDLRFCCSCSSQLHGKKARQHHQLRPLPASPLCDECETASAKVECFDCGGRRKALVFCLDCSARLHSRAARAAHHVDLIACGSKHMETVIDLTNLDSDEEDGSKVGKSQEHRTDRHLVGKVPVEREARHDDDMRKASEKRINDGHLDHKNFKKGGKQLSPLMGNPAIRDEAGMHASLTDGKQPPGNRNTRNRKERPTQASSPKEESSTDTGSEINESDEEYGGVHCIKRGSVSLEAFVVDADDQVEDGPLGAAIPEGKVEVGIKDRIKKMLELGLHPDTPEIEAQQALKNAQRLLTKHNLQQAEVWKGNLTDTSSLTGGMRVVELRANSKTKLGRMQAWVQDLGWVIADNFDCQYFFKTGTSSKPLRVVFYGISHNADCAGYAFAATFNRIATMSAAYLASAGAPEDDKENQDATLRRLKQSTYTRVARANYRKGIVAGLTEAVKTAQRMRRETVLRNEIKQEDDTGDEPCNDTDSLCGNGGEEQTTSSTDSPNDTTSTVRMEERCMAITALVMHSQKVGEQYLKQIGIKLRKRTPRSRISAWNEEAFVQGKKDAKTIDINQRGITGGKVKKPRGSS